MPTTQLTLTVPAAYNNNFWTNYAAAVASDNAYASIDAGGVTSRLLTFQTNVGAAVAANAILLGIRIDVEYRTSAVGTNSQMRVSLGAQSSSGVTSYVTGTTSDVVYTFGGATNKLGASVPSDVSHFTVEVREQMNNSKAVFQFIDSAACWVYWELPPPPPAPARNVLFLGEIF